ncbi:MAG: hypothetical protein QOD07_1854 [Frankiaceae bacterium]|nr:hypothetical protein [Frankiaceae bacterium]
MPRLSAASVPAVAGLVLAATAVVVGAPVVGSPSVDAHPVAPATSMIAVTALPATRGVVADTGRRATQKFGLVGATWRSGSLAAGAQVQIRVRQHGTWSGWNPLTLPDGGPDDGSRDARAAAHRHVTATDPLWVGSADGVEARVVSARGDRPATAPAGLSVVLVDGGSSPADAAAHPATAMSTAAAAMSQPTVYTRAQWGADERLRTYNSGCGTPDYGSTVKMGFIHHTDGANGYPSSAVPSIIRSIYAYHVESNGWCDIGYNFLVDRFGRIWEGRYGGITKPVIGAHTGGFNTDSFGTSLIGNFTSTAPPAAMVSATEKLFAWRLGAYYRDPTATTTMLAGSFGGSRYAAGSTVTFKVVSGHRDADTTTCPGSAAYAQLPTIRSAVKSLIGAGLVAPTVSPTSIRMLSGQAVSVHSGVLRSQAWTLTVTNSTGNVVRSLTGSATPTAPIAGTWDGTDDLGAPVPPGTYTVLLSSTTSSSSALPYSTKVTVTPPVTVTGPAVAGYGQQVKLTGTAPTGSDVTLSLTRAGTALPAQLIHTTAPTWTATFTADEDYTWSAAVNGYSTPSRSTRVAPVVTSPVATGNTVFLTKATALRLAGTALPSAGPQVTLTTTSLSTGTTQATLPAAVAANGSWSAVTTPSIPVSVAVTDARGLSSTPLTVYPVDPPAASAPSTGYSARTLTVTGNAGHAPVAVRVLTKPPGASSFAVAAMVTAAPTGAFTAKVTLPAVATSSSLPWRVSTGYGADATGTTTVLPTFAPTATAPASGHYGVPVGYTGKAVPGDRVKLYTRAVGAKTFAWTATATADPRTGAFTLAVALRRDIEWAVQTPSGQTATKQVLVAPTLSAPASVLRRTVVTIAGTGVPGWKVAVYQRFHGTTVRTLIGTLTVNSLGRWSLKRMVDHPSDFWCVAAGRASRTVSVSTR